MNNEEKQKNYALADELYSEQNFVAAAVIGVIAAVIAAAAYGIIATKWSFSHGFAMASIGIVVGISMQFLGRGISAKFAALAAVYTIAACLLGNIFTVALRPGFIAAGSLLDALQGISILEVLKQSTFDIHLGDLIYFFIAIVAAVFLVKRPLSRAERLAIGMSNLRD
ncbi:MAG: hypothetical protein ACR2QL_04155 [Woeseiaceae bacterium]